MAGIFRTGIALNAADANERRGQTSEGRRAAVLQRTVSPMSSVLISSLTPESVELKFRASIS